MRQDYLSNISALVMVAIGLLAGIFTFSGCAENNEIFHFGVADGQQQPYVMVIKYQSDDYSTGISGQITKSLDYTKIPYNTLDLEIISGEFEIPESVRTLVITSYEATQLPEEDIHKLIDFAARGNTIVFTGPFTDDKFSYLQGIRPDIDYSFDTTSTGFVLFDELFPGMKGKTFNPRGLEPHRGLKANQFNSEIEVLAGTASDSTQPFIVSNQIGKGEVLTINSYAINNKLYRGVMFSAMLRGLSGIPYLVANVSTIFLDDFPAPVYNEKMPPIDEEYDVTHAEFVSKIWWPDMKALADTFDINYSAMTAFNYNANVVPPFDFQEWRHGSILYNQNIVQGSIFLAKDIRDSRHELAFHGYNHFSLWKEDWENINFMISALHAARKRWQVDDMGPLPTNYVPPTNHIDSIGIQAVIRGMPSIRYMSSLYMGEVEDGGGREFDPEPYAPGELFNYPRITSGFTMSENSQFDQMGLQLMTGIWTHFVHPDDVFQVVQRDADEFASRNPLGLGWKSNSEHEFGLYHLLKRRIKLTQELYPGNSFISATRGGKITEDWRRSLTSYKREENLVLVETSYRENYVPKVAEHPRNWFMYVTESQVKEIEKILGLQDLRFHRTPLWKGYLYQFKTEKPFFFIPDNNPERKYDKDTLDQLAGEAIQTYQQRYVVPEEPTEPWEDTRMEDALAALNQAPDDLNAQEQILELSAEFNRMYQAINILENRLLNQQNWQEIDTDRLITYYGWEGMQAEAEQFLERLWERHGNQEVIALKNQAVAELGLYGPDFEQRWLKREVALHPDDFKKSLTYTKMIESQERWPEMKQNLLELIQQRPDSDSLYAFTLQRSFYYDSPDSTLALLQRFPDSAQPQLLPFAGQIAQLYAYTAGDYEKALYWANNAPGFDERQKLYWLAALDLDQLYLANARRMIAGNPDDDSLRSFIGTNLFYQGMQQEGYKVLYPLFVDEAEKGFTADTLVRAEIGYMTYPQKKSFYKQYPLFFDNDQRVALANLHRTREGVRAVISGEYRDDNFDNAFARSAVGVQFGNRQAATHTLKAENLLFTDDERTDILNEDFYGLGYEFTSRSEDQRIIFTTGASILAGQSDVVPEALASLGISGDSAYTSVQISGGAELTSTAVQNDYYQGQLQLYRQDYWWNGTLTTGLSATGKYYTNNVFEYGGQGRLFANLTDGKWRVRTIGELGYYDATKSFLTGIPYYTPDEYFSQGMGLDLQFRNPDTFEYRTQIDAEVFAKHERLDGFFFSGRLQMELKLNNFWELNVGSEISTSRVYRSNRVFITISHYFPTKFWKANR